MIHRETALTPGVVSVLVQTQLTLAGCVMYKESIKSVTQDFVYRLHNTDLVQSKLCSPVFSVPRSKVPLRLFTQSVSLLRKWKW